MSDWFKSKKGNWCHRVEEGVVTVFETQEGRYKYVSDGNFSDDSYDTELDAMEDAEKEYLP